jgi:hypothetical protein
LISEIEIKRLSVSELESYDSKGLTDKKGKRKGKRKGKKPRSTSIITSIPKPKRVCLLIDSKVSLFSFVQTTTNLKPSLKI